MLSKLMKILLVTTSFAPVFITLWFAEYSLNWDISKGWNYLVITIFMIFLCLLIMSLSKKHLEMLPVEIQSISTSDKEVTSFIIAYLLPLINRSAFQVDGKLLFFVIALFFFSIFTTNSYHFNPVLGFFGFHFYEVTIKGGITYVLITKKSLTNTKSIKEVVQISEYMILEV